MAPSITKSREDSLSGGLAPYNMRSFSLVMLQTPNTLIGKLLQIAESFSNLQGNESRTDKRKNLSSVDHLTMHRYNRGSQSSDHRMLNVEPLSFSKRYALL